MIEYTQYKEITCDLCGKKARFDPVYSYPYLKGFRKIEMHKTHEMFTCYEVCESCFKKVEMYIEENINGFTA